MTLILLIVFLIFLIVTLTAVLIIYFSLKNARYKSEMHISGGANLETGRISSDDNYFKGISGDVTNTVVIEDFGKSKNDECVKIKIVNLSNSETTVLTLTDYVIIGRQGGKKSYSLSMDPTVSKAHCKIYVASGRLYLYDLHSINHTFLNGVQVTSRAECKSGDVINVGNTKIRIFF